VDLYHVRINGSDADVTGGNEFTVRITFSGGEYNTEDADALFPKIMIWDRTTLGFGGPTTGLPYNLRVGGQVGTAVELVALGSGSIDLLFKGITFDDWTLVLDM